MDQTSMLKAILESASQMSHGVTQQWNSRCLAAVQLLKEACALVPSRHPAEVARGLIWTQSTRLRASSLRTFKSALLSGARWTLHEDLSHHPEFEGVHRWVSRNLALHPPEPKPAMKPAMVAHIMNAATPVMRSVIKSLWGTSSRFSDLKNATLTDTDLKLAAHKGDYLGRIGYHKFLPGNLVKDMGVALKAVKEYKVSYNHLYSHIRRHAPGHAVVSIRRGAMTLLSETCEVRDLMLIGTHSSEVSSRRYVAPHPNQREPRKLLEMSSLLLNSLPNQ